MSVNILSENIARLRKEAGMTQEELGRAVSVSTQAVSRWERGGTPDVLLLPAIADVLGVTVDTLLGKVSSSATQLEELLKREILVTPPEQRLSKACELAWLIDKYTTCSFYTDSDTFFRFMTGSENAVRKGVENPQDVPIMTYTVHGSGLMQAATAADFKYMLIMPEPEGGYSSVLKYCEEYRSFFEFLAKPHCLEMMAFTYTVNPAEYFDAALASKKLKIEKELAEDILKEMSCYRMVRDIQVKTPNGEIHVYHSIDSPTLVPFLVLASEIMRAQNTFCVAPFRTTPLLRDMPGEQSEFPTWTAKDTTPKSRTCPRGIIDPTDKM